MLRRAMSRRTSSLLVRLSLAAFALLGAATYATPASAAPAFTLQRGTIGGGIRFGTEDLNFGLGVRGGYTLDMGVYLGGLFDYWFGDSDEVNTFVGTQESSYSAWDFMGVVGYDAGITPSIVIRPFGGFGIVHEEAEVCGTVIFANGCVDSDDSDGAAVLGGEALFEIGRSLHVGGELRILIYGETALAFGGNIGGTF
jgi:outer membrane protein with beta-barrel domain